MVTDNAHLIALNRTTGRLVWETVMPDEPQHYGGTMSPLVVKDMVIAGVSGGAVRGFGELGSETAGGRQHPDPSNCQEIRVFTQRDQRQAR